ELLRGRLAPPLRLEQQRELGELVESQSDLFRRSQGGPTGGREAVDAEQHGTDQQEMHQRLAEETLHAGPKRECPPSIVLRLIGGTAGRAGLLHQPVEPRLSARTTPYPGPASACPGPAPPPFSACPPPRSPSARGVASASVRASPGTSAAAP